MNPDLQKQLAGLVEDARKVGMPIFDYIQTHAPAFAKQILDWYYYATLWDLCAAGGAALTCISFSIFFFVKVKKTKWNNDGYIAGGVLTLVAACIIFFAGICPNIRNLIKLRVAPQLVLVQQIQRSL